jgi:hypothetical protein
MPRSDQRTADANAHATEKCDVTFAKQVLKIPSKGTCRCDGKDVGSW